VHTSHPDIDFVPGSVLDPLLVDELVASVDVVVHLAAAVGVRLIVEEPLKSFITNIKGSENILEASHRYRRKVLLASTSEIYGKNTRAPYSEDDDRVLGSPKVSRWAYSTAKAVDEILAYAYYRERGLPTIVVRLFNTVGPRQSGAYGMVVPRFVEQALAGEPVTVYGDGNQSRCFCHVEDVVRAFIGLLDEPRAAGDVFNIGATEEISMVDLARRVISRTDSNSPIKRVPYGEAYDEGFEDMRRRVPNISKIQQLLGWTPTHTLDEIIDDVVTDQRTVREKSLPLDRDRAFRLRSLYESR
jgi:nucleoside-diphosphate-sugar epimerase